MKILDVPRSGSVNGTTSSRNRFGQYVRTRATPVNPNTGAQTAKRDVFAQCAQLWRTLTSVQQAAWSYFAQAHPRLDSLGQTIVLTGAQMYSAINCQLMGLTGVTVDEPPSAGPLAAPVLTIDDDSIAAPISLAYTPTPTGAGLTMVLFCSPPQTRGRSFCGDFRILTTVAPATASPVEILDALEAKWGTVNIFQRFFLRARFVYTEGGPTKGWYSPDSDIIILDPTA